MRPGHSKRQRSTSSNSNADLCYSRQKMSGCVYLTTTEYSIPHRHDIHVRILPRLSTASDEIQDAHGSRRSCKTHNGAGKLAVRALPCENCSPATCPILGMGLAYKNCWHVVLHRNPARRKVFLSVFLLHNAHNVLKTRRLWYPQHDPQARVFFLKRPNSQRFSATRFQPPNLKSGLARSSVRT